MTYIYLNTYTNGYLYVGSHTWDGEGIDPNYHGSSSVAKKYHWNVLSIEILEVIVDDARKFIAEKDWIEHYASQYGIADCAMCLSKRNGNAWCLKYSRNGLLLNCHANTLEQAHTSESRKKAIQARINNGTQFRPTLETMKNFLDNAHTEKVLLKRLNSRRCNARRCRLSDGFEGNCPEIERHTGLNHGTVSTAMSRAFKKGIYKLSIGITLTPIFQQRACAPN